MLQIKMFKFNLKKKKFRRNWVPGVIKNSTDLGFNNTDLEQSRNTCMLQILVKTILSETGNFCI